LSPAARSYLIDAGALALYFAGDDVAKPYFDRILSGQSLGFISEVNLAEFYYKTAQKLGLQTAEARFHLVITSRIASVSTDPQISMGAGNWKVKRPSLSLADSFAVATMEGTAEVLLTTDPELKKAAGTRGILLRV
jgi:uncharacterized protein